ncbi:MAG: hypothetical protein ACRD2X_15085 [Vicinamibacteraceae bacterium]
MTSERWAARPTARAVILGAAFFAVLFPTSIGGAISPLLDRLSILFNVAVFAALLVVGRCVGSRLQAMVSVAILGWLSTLTLLSPHARLAPGLVAMFVALALMLATNTKAVTDRQATKRTLACINVFALAIGAALCFDLQWADRFIKAYYTAFYPTIHISMLDWHDKPVLTFATHSIAGFFYYLFFYLNFRTYAVTGSGAALAAAVGHIALGLALRSTTGSILLTLAAGQLAVAVYRRHGRQVAWLPLVAPVVIVGLLVSQADRLLASIEPVREIVVGTESSGLLSRYSSTGMLGGNLRYLNDSPFSPLGFNYGLEHDLFYGDSGFIQFLLRGSLPLVLLVYGGLYGFLRSNLRSRTDVRWLYIVILAFDLGIVSLFSFRITSFLVFMIVYLNSLERSRSTGVQAEHHA